MYPSAYFYRAIYALKHFAPATDILMIVLSGVSQSIIFPSRVATCAIKTIFKSTLHLKIVLDSRYPLKEISMLSDPFDQLMI
jgi:hypothetical protein